jgi:thiaminase
MYTLQNLTMSMASMSYSPYESFVAFTGSISGAYEAAEYRATLYNQGAANNQGNATGNAIWQGSIQVYASQSIDKSVYENQIPPITSHASENRYIILN